MMGDEDYRDQPSIKTIFLVFFVVMGLLIMLFSVFPWMVETYIGYETITETHIVTDKWSKEVGGFLSGSSTHFYLELDNTTEKEVDSLEYSERMSRL